MPKRVSSLACTTKSKIIVQKTNGFRDTQNKIYPVKQGSCREITGTNSAGQTCSGEARHPNIGNLVYPIIMKWWYH